MGGVWDRFRERLMQDNDQAQYLRDWQLLQKMTHSPAEALRRLSEAIATDGMNDTQYQHFRNALTMANAAYAHRAQLVGISDPQEWERRYRAYLAGPDTEAAQYDTLLNLRGQIDSIRPLPQQAPPFSSEEMRLADACNRLFNSKLAVLLNRASPGASRAELEALIGELDGLVAEYRRLLAGTDPGNRARPQALNAIANAQYAAGRASLILKNYQNARAWFQAALQSFENLADKFGIRAARMQLSALEVVSSGDADAAVRANLETLVCGAAPAGLLDRAQALVSQIQQASAAGDWFAVRRLIQETVDELARQNYPSDEKVDAETALASWIEAVPANLMGNDFLEQLAKVITLSAALWGARANLQAPEARERLARLSQLVQRAFQESLQADGELQRRFTAAAARPLMPPQSVAGV